jgi:hypothetical protein
MQNDENEKNKIKVIKKMMKSFLSQPELTQLAYHQQHEFGIKKIDLKKKPSKKDQN